MKLILPVCAFKGILIVPIEKKILQSGAPLILSNYETDSFTVHSQRYVTLGPGAWWQVQVF